MIDATLPLQTALAAPRAGAEVVGSHRRMILNRQKNLNFEDLFRKTAATLERDSDFCKDSLKTTKIGKKAKTNEQDIEACNGIHLPWFPP